MGPFPIPGMGAPPSPLPTPGGAPPAQPGGLPGLPDPGALQQYENETQADGTVLLRLKMPDGRPGPVIQIVKPPKPGKGLPQGAPMPGTQPTA